MAKRTSKGQRAANKSIRQLGKSMPESAGPPTARTGGSAKVDLGGMKQFGSSDPNYNAEVLDRAGSNPDGPSGKPIKRNQRLDSSTRQTPNQALEGEARSRAATSRAAGRTTGTVTTEVAGPEIGGVRRAARTVAGQVSKRGLLAAATGVGEVVGLGLLAKGAYDEASQQKKRQKQFEIDTSKQGSTNYVKGPKATGVDDSPGAKRAARREMEKAAGVPAGFLNTTVKAPKVEQSGYGAPQPSSGMNEDNFMADAVVSETFAKPEADRTYSQPTMKSGGALDSSVASDTMAKENAPSLGGYRDYNDLAGAYNELRNKGKLKQSF